MRMAGFLSDPLAISYRPCRERLGAISSVGLEHPVYIRRVGGSSPSSPTIFTHLDKNFLTRDVALNCCVASMKQRFARLVAASPIIIGLARGGVKKLLRETYGKLIVGRNGRSWNVWPPQLCVSGRKPLLRRVASLWPSGSTSRRHRGG